MSATAPFDSSPLRHDWQPAELLELFDLPFTELLHRAASVHRQHFDPAEVNVSKSFGDGGRSTTVNMSIRVEQSDGPGYGHGYGGRYPYYAPDVGYPFPPR